ncbi:hypothetical protein KKA50_00660 [Patescibacteria group bacterium]|nr:hypothetical protein [Patescibacteria group bacterium]
MSILYVLLTTFGVIFLESFLVALANLRFLFLLNVSLFNKINWKHLLSFSLLSSLILDVIYHYVLGTNLLMVAVPLLIMLLISLIVPLENSLPGYSVKFVCIFLYYLFVSFVPNLILTGQGTVITGVMLGGMVLKAAISVLFCVVFDVVWSRLRKKEEGTKLRSL